MAAPANQVQFQGQGAINADAFNTFTQTSLSVAALRSFTALDTMTTLMLGTTTPGDGGQGTFYYDADSVAPDDGGTTTIVPNDQTQGAWIRLPAASGSIAPNSITNAMLAQAPGPTLKGNLLLVTANETDNGPIAVTAFLNPATTSLQGVAPLATTAQAIAGTNATNIITPATMTAAITNIVSTLVINTLNNGFYQSGQITIAIGASGTLTHGLGAMPKRVWCVLICTTAINQYGIGDEIPVNENDDSEGQHGPLAWAKAGGTQLGYQMPGGSSDNTISILSTTSAFAATASNFVMVVRASLY